MRREKTAEQQEQVQLRQEGKTTTELLKQACRDANASVEVGNDTNTKLSKQGEQMSSMSNTLDNIEYELKVSDRIMKGMSSWGGMVSSWFTSAPKAPKESKVEVVKQERQRRPQETKPAKPAPLEKKSSPVNEDRDEDDRLLDALHNDLKIMKSQAKTQREVIKEQNTKLDELVKKNEAVTQHMRSTDRKVRQML
ncbi:Hypothetical protein, putative [Bodo saltans]|uniref:t-SNARE coiled-coil homology domain-containing protein n=1 Tax=Bodo saltans TaxID=75058 RepID=A0A0S4IWR2_BODSA|nr:Hypothetical protein, putative [Bodo saltans]|eukprot:CUG30418.1 Hypothetical protein, putative [Bodo saltans]